MVTISKMALRGGIAAAVSAVALTAPAEATVTYTFEATSALNGAPFGNFEFTAANFLTGGNAVPLVDLTSCNVTFVGFGSPDCGPQLLADNFFASHSAVFFQTDNGSQTVYYFPLLAFSTIGSHDSEILGPDQFATLTVSSTNNAVPEPGTWATMLAGFGLMGFALRRRGKQVVRVRFG